MYSDGQTGPNGLVRAMSTDNGEVQVSSPSSYLLDDGGVDGGERNNVVSFYQFVEIVDQVY